MAFREFLDVSLRLLEAEHPSGYARLLGLLEGREARVTMDGKTLGIAFRREGFDLHDDVPHPFIELRATRDEVLAVAAGELSLEKAVREERVWLRGRLEDVVRFHESLLAYLHSAVRCPSFPWLLGEYTSGAPPRTARLTQRIRSSTLD